MAWETRRSGGRYLYRSVREGGRVRKEYLGTGWLAEAAEQQAELERAERRARAREEQRQVEAVLQGEADARALARAAAAIVRASLHAAGYRQHHRGEWRRPRARATRLRSRRR